MRERVSQKNGSAIIPSLPMAYLQSVLPSSIILARDSTPLTGSTRRQSPRPACTTPASIAWEYREKRRQSGSILGSTNAEAACGRHESNHSQSIRRSGLLTALREASLLMTIFETTGGNRCFRGTYDTYWYVPSARVIANVGKRATASRETRADSSLVLMLVKANSIAGATHKEQC